MCALSTTSLTLQVSNSVGGVDALLLRPADARSLLVCAHGAGAGMHHPFLEGLAHELAGCRVATLRYQFPYMQARRKRPDPPSVLTATVTAAVRTALEAAPDLPLLAGGKSLGGRITSLAAVQPSAAGFNMDPVRGLVFFGFPLHPAGRPGTQRAERLSRVERPMLFLQGTRDALADLALLRPLCDTLVPLATLHVVEGADHSFHVLKRFGKSDAEVLRELARTTASWAEGLG
jgi:predicted alpha/beta-hydrolase family hydrolase